MVDEARARRVADRIKTVTAANLESIVKDPDLGFVTLTARSIAGSVPTPRPVRYFQRARTTRAASATNSSAANDA